MRAAGTQLLLLVQIIIIGVLIARVYDLGMQVDALSEERAVQASPSVVSSIAARPEFQSINAPEANFDVAMQATVRQIIREELQDFSANLLDDKGNPAIVTAEARPAPTIPADPALPRKVNDQLYALIAQGQASQGELFALEANIARLPPEERKKAFAELNRAVNDGRLKARF